MPNLSVGDALIESKTDLLRLKKETYILAVSDSTCERCCLAEIFLKDIHNLLRKKIYFKGKQVKLVRIDFNKHKKLIVGEIPHFDNVPKFLVHHNQEFYMYDEGFSVELFMHFVNRHLYPVVILKTHQ